jgi:hypothetical protein
MSEQARNIYSLSLHPKYGYPFAIVGINITAWIQMMLKEGHLKTHFYNDSDLLSTEKIEIESFHKIYCKSFLRFKYEIDS